MKYKIFLNDEDFVRFNIFYMNHTKAGKRSKNAIRWMLPMIFVLSILILVLADAEPGLIIAEVIAMTIGSIIWIAITPKIAERGIRKNIRKLKADGKLSYSPESEIEFQELKFVEKSDRGETHVNYKNIENVYAEEDYLYIFISANQGFILPRQCLGADWDRVIAYLEVKRSWQLFT